MTQSLPGPFSHFSLFSGNHPPQERQLCPNSLCQYPGSQSYFRVPGNCLFHHDWRCSSNYPTAHSSRGLLIHMNWRSILFNIWVSFWKGCVGATGAFWALSHPWKVVGSFCPSLFHIWYKWWRIHLQCQRSVFNPWVGKRSGSWRGTWQPTPVFLSGDSSWTGEPGGLQSTWSQSQTRLSNLAHSASGIW